MKRSFAWRWVERRLRRTLPEAAASAALGDLFEEYQRTREQHGRIRAEWTLWREARSLKRAYLAINETAGNQQTPASHPGRGGWALGDIRGGLRMVRREPGLAGAIIVPVALAVATSTALFSIVDGLLFRPLPYADVGRLVSLR